MEFEGGTAIVWNRFLRIYGVLNKVSTEYGVRIASEEILYCNYPRKVDSQYVRTLHTITIYGTQPATQISMRYTPNTCCRLGKVCMGFASSQHSRSAAWSGLLQIIETIREVFLFDVFSLLPTFDTRMR